MEVGFDPSAGDVDQQAENSIWLAAITIRVLNSPGRSRRATSAGSEHAAAEDREPEVLRLT